MTAAFGEGHNAAARNLAAALRKHWGGGVEVRDIFQEAYGPVNGFVRRLYLLAINHAPWVWGVVFRVLDRTAVVGGGIGVFGRAARLLARTVAVWKPGVIVSTYPGYGHLLDLLRRRGEAPGVRLATVITDSLTVNSVWYRCGSDIFLVANAATRDVVLAGGVAPGRVEVTGFPVPLEFARPAARPAPPPFRVLFMVNSSHHLAAGVVRELVRVPGIALTVTVGRDARLAGELEEMGISAGVEIRVLGWVDDMPAELGASHLLISKAGGATVQEAMAAGVPMVVTQVVPGQEEGNARLVLEGGAGEFAATPPDIAGCVRRWTDNAGRVWEERRRAAARLGVPDGASRAADVIESLWMAGGAVNNS